MIQKGSALMLHNCCKFLKTEFAAYSKPTSRDDHRKAYYPSIQQRDQGAG